MIKPQVLYHFLYPHNQPLDEQTPEAQTQTPEEQTTPCPKLAFLEIIDNYDEIDPEMIATWARIRKHLGSPLRKLYLSLPSLIDKFTLRQTERLKLALGSRGRIRTLGPDKKSGSKALDKRRRSRQCTDFLGIFAIYNVNLGRIKMTSFRRKKQLKNMQIIINSECSGRQRLAINVDKSIATTNYSFSK